LRKFAEPVENDSATNGRMNDANMAIDHTAAFVPMSFIFCVDVMSGNPVSTLGLVLVATSAEDSIMDRSDGHFGPTFCLSDVCDIP
jgi:hypothetical protein